MEKDRIKVQIEFKRALWTCHKCGKEDIEDFNVGGGNTYEHNCSNCNQWTNSFKEYNGIVNLSMTELETIKPEEYLAKKNNDFDSWVYDIKHPRIAVEPTKEELLKLLSEKNIEVQELQEKITAKEAK